MSGSLATATSGGLDVEGRLGAASGEVYMSRLYNPNSGEHFYTANAVERDSLVGEGWRDEGVGWTAPALSATPVYRLYNPNAGDHHYTFDANESDALQAAGWNYEGIGWYSADAGERVGLFREYNPYTQAGSHNYTLNYDENAVLVSGGWLGEGVAWYGVPSPFDLQDGWIRTDDGWRLRRGGLDVTGEWVVTEAGPPISAAGPGVRRYWLGENGLLAVSRLIDPIQLSDAAAGYLAYATDRGYVVVGKMDTGAGRVYISESDGRLPDVSGWLVSDRYDGRMERYFIDGSMHAAISGEFNADGNRFWGTAGEGYVARNMMVCVMGSWCRADNDGALTVDDVVNRLVAMAQGYSSPSRYLILVDVDDPRTVVFEGRRGNWDVKFIWDCCTGAPNSPTVLGVFSVGMRGYSFGEGHGYSCYYWTQFYGDYLFHTRKYYAYSRELLDGRMGQRVSEGCVRLYDEDALWIWHNVPSGTTVVTTR